MYKLTYSLLTIEVHSVVTMALFSTISELRRLICRKLRFFCTKPVSNAHIKRVHVRISEDVLGIRKLERCGYRAGTNSDIMFNYFDTIGLQQHDKRTSRRLRG